MSMEHIGPVEDWSMNLDPEVQPYIPTGVTPEESAAEILQLWQDATDANVTDDVQEKAYLVSMTLAQRRLGSAAHEPVESREIAVERASRRLEIGQEALTAYAKSKNARNQ